MNEKSSPSAIVDAMPEVFVSHAPISAEVSRRVARGRLRKLATRLYTRDPDTDAEVLVRRNLWDIVAGYFPGALLADRTALELEPARDGSVCLVTQRGADIALPGIVLRPRRGAPPTAEDRPFLAGLFLSSPARAYLDNLRASRTRRGRLPRTLRRRDIEAHLERMFAAAGETAGNRLREDARRVAPVIDRMAQLAELDAIVGALAGTREARLSAPHGTRSGGRAALRPGSPGPARRAACRVAAYPLPVAPSAAARRHRKRNAGVLRSLLLELHRGNGVHAGGSGGDRLRRTHSRPASSRRTRRAGRLAHRVRRGRDASPPGNRGGAHRGAARPSCRHVRATPRRGARPVQDRAEPRRRNRVRTAGRGRRHSGARF